jgi:hypothetical protein
MSFCTYVNLLSHVIIIEELDVPTVSVLRRAIAEVKQRWSVIGWVTKNLLSRAPPCFDRTVKQLVPAVFAFGMMMIIGIVMTEHTL